MRSAANSIRILVTLCHVLILDAALVLGAEAAKIGVDAINVEPASPAPSTLCKLKVRLKNSGSLPVSYLRFGVKIDGQDVPTYKSQSFVVNIDPGTAGEVNLYNFYSPLTAKSFDVQVTLVEAQWVQVKKVETNTTTITPAGPVEGLPISGTLQVKMSTGK